MEPSDGSTPKPIRVAVQNFADQTTIKEDELKEKLPKIQSQVNDDFIGTYWKSVLDSGSHEVELYEIDQRATPAEGEWLAQIFNDAQQSILKGRVKHMTDADFGYHDLDPKRNLPYIIVLAKTAQMVGYPWTIPFSHELLEALADPTGVQTKQVGQSIYVFEVCDPVAMHSYTLEGVRVSNFVTPAWFGIDVPLAELLDAGGQVGEYDYVRALSGPGQIAPGGYKSSVISGRGWQTARNANGQYVMVPENLNAPGPTVRSRPRLDRAVQAAAMQSPAPSVRLATVENRVAGQGASSQPSTGTTGAGGMVCSMCSMVCSMCSMVCSMCSMVCSMCSTSAICCGSGQGQSTGTGDATLANLGYS